MIILRAAFCGGLAVFLSIALSSCGGGGGGLGGSKGVSPEVLKDALLFSAATEPGMEWSFQGDRFFLGRQEAAPLPLELVKKLTGAEYETPWVEGKWSVGGKKLKLSDVRCNGQSTASAGSISIALDGENVKLGGESYTVKAGGAGNVAELSQERLIAFKNSEKNTWGYRSSQTGQELLPPIYEMAWDFSPEGLACVREGEPYLINKKGEHVLQPLWVDEGPDVFREGLARYFDGEDKMGFYEASGRVVVPATYDFATPFENGLALVNVGGERSEDNSSATGGNWGAVNLAGELVLQVKYPELVRQGNAFRMGDEGQWFRVGGNIGLARE